jgi:hypothetical protein
MDQIEYILDFMGEFDHGHLDIDWLRRHIKVLFEDSTHTMTMVIDNINEEDYTLMKSV